MSCAISVSEGLASGWDFALGAVYLFGVHRPKDSDPAVNGGLANGQLRCNARYGHALLEVESVDFGEILLVLPGFY